jgi:hypothetical protein
MIKNRIKSVIIHQYFTLFITYLIPLSSVNNLKISKQTYFLNIFGFNFKGLGLNRAKLDHLVRFDGL